MRVELIFLLGERTLFSESAMCRLIRFKLVRAVIMRDASLGSLTISPPYSIQLSFKSWNQTYRKTE